MASIREQAAKNLANLKATGGIPKKPVAPAPLSPGAQQIQTRVGYQNIPEGDVRHPGMKSKYDTGQ